MTMLDAPLPELDLDLDLDLAAVQQAFLAELPRMNAVIRFNTRRWPRHRRQEARQDALAACWHAWIGLARRGQDPRSVGPCGLARNAVRYVKNGRKLGSGEPGRKLDLHDRRARRRAGYQIVSLDQPADPRGSRASLVWREWLIADHHMTPADLACSRLDFSAWLAQLPERKRRIALALAGGSGTVEVARSLGVTPGAVSQMRTSLATDWARFQDQPAGAC